MEKTWTYDTLQYVRIDTDARVLSWWDDRRGCEGGADQSVDDFIASGPLVGIRSIDRGLLVEMLRFLKIEHVDWLDPDSTIKITIQGTDVLFYDDPWLLIHDDSLHALVQKVGLGKEAFYRRYPLMQGHLAQETELQGLSFRKGTEIMFHRSGKVRMGTLARSAEIGGAVRQAGSTVWLKEDGVPDFT